MSGIRKRRKTHNSRFKAKVALEAVRERKTASEIASGTGVHVSQVQKWKKEVLDRLHELFENPSTKDPDKEKLIEQLYQQIGKLQVELDWLKKKSGEYL